jgi:hypothetical protein
MYIHSPRRLAEWAELIDAELPEYIRCNGDNGNDRSDE